jgi:thermitase
MKSYVCLSLLAVIAANAQERPDHFVKDRLLVQRIAEASHENAKKAFALNGASEESEIAPLRIHVLRVPSQAIDKVRAALLQSGQFVFVERDGVASGQAMPVDTLLASQWHLYKIDMPGAWLTTSGSTSVPIAILDSGVDGAHSDLASKLVAGYNFLTMNTDTADRSGHGTQVAGSAAAATNNNLGVASVAGNNPILPVVVMDSSNYATYSNIARGITYAADRGVRIINISITGPTSSSTLQSAVDYAWSKNAVVFAAAGNSGSTAPGYPAACAKVVAVGATDENDARAGWSNYGSWITVVAPGVNVLTTLAGGSYGGASGTSFASPIAAGVGALMLSVRPQLTAADLTSLLRSSTRDLGAPGVDSEFGGGRVDANRAVLAAQQAVLQTVAPPPTTIQPKPGKGNRK